VGDRANIVNITGPEPTDTVVLYVHWAGSLLPDIATKGIDVAGPRWGDASYALRMALTQWIGKMTGSTGAGVSSDLGDNEHDLIVIDWSESRVAVVPWPHYCIHEFVLAWTAALEVAEWVPFADVVADDELLRRRFR
jgi:hypothetical protein